MAIMTDAQTAFDKAYWASQPPEIRALLVYAESDRKIRAADLASKGFVIDVPIMVWGWDAYLAMKLRSDFGFTWVPSALQPNVTVAPGISPLAGQVAYDPAHPPAGSIKVSLDLADYPPFPTPSQPTSAPASTALVGPQSIGNLYLSVVGDTSPDGTKFTDSRGTFLKHVIATPFGRNAYWELVAPATSG